jgi:diaminopimelate decarboxylase
VSRPASDFAGAARARSRGVVPLTGRLEPWMEDLCAAPQRLAGLIAEHGSPVNLLELSALGRNAEELGETARLAGVDLGIYLARKANKSLALVDEALRLGLGVDLASERELEQALARGAAPERLVMSAAVKPRSLLELCARSGATVVIDNGDELRALQATAGEHRVEVPIAIRLAPESRRGRPETRFGIAPGEALALLGELGPDAAIRVDGVHFHLDGYDAGDRVAALEQALDLTDGLIDAGREPRWIDIGGGIPISYLDNAAEWAAFQAEQGRALLGEREPLTFEAHGLGLRLDAGAIAGKLNVYPGYQRPIRGGWLAEILAAPIGGETVAAAVNRRGLSLRCEPGRSLLDGCGATAARVEFRKQRRDGTWLIGLAMNRTQLRSTADDFPCDPLLLRSDDDGPTTAGESIEGYLVGAYCIERELLSWRRFRFAEGVEVGDVVLFPNTGGYMMHILESASHQIPLARNLVLSGGCFALDPIDAAQRSVGP